MECNSSGIRRRCWEYDGALDWLLLRFQIECGSFARCSWRNYTTDGLDRDSEHQGVLHS